MFALLFVLLACSAPSEDSSSSPSGREPIVAADQEIECSGENGYVSVQPRDGVPYVMTCSSGTCRLSTAWTLNEILAVPCAPGDTVSVIWL